MSSSEAVAGVASIVDGRWTIDDFKTMKIRKDMKKECRNVWRYECKYVGRLLGFASGYTSFLLPPIH